MKKHSFVTKLVAELLLLSKPTLMKRKNISMKIKRNESTTSHNGKKCFSIFLRRSSADITPVTCSTGSKTCCCCGVNTKSNNTNYSSEDIEYIISVLFYAVQYKNTELLKEILKRIDIDVNQLNEDGISVLHFAAIVGGEDCIKMLRQYGGCVNTLDVRGQTPIYYAQMMNNREAAQVLK